MKQPAIKDVYNLTTILLIALATASLARPTDTPTQTAVVTGRIIDTAGKPVSGAFVAAYDAKKNVVSSAHTDAKGEYSLAVPRAALHVDRKGKTFFTQVSANFNRAVSVAGTVIPVVHTVSSGSDAIRNSRGHGPQSPQTIVVDSSLAPVGSTKLPSPADAQKLPGALMVKAVAPGCVDLTAVTQAYWIQQETSNDSTSSEPTIVGWMDPLVLARISANKSSTVTPVPVRISAAQVSPSLVKHGDTTQLTATLTLPSEPKIYPVVVARDYTSGEMWELKSAGGGKYVASIRVDESFKPNDHIVSVMAYAAEGKEGGRRPDLEDEILKAKLWDLKRQFVCNPLLVVSRNRADITLTVVPDSNSVTVTPSTSGRRLEAFVLTASTPL